MNVIFIEKLIVMAMVGVYDWEQHQLQKLIFDLKLGFSRNFKYFMDKRLNYIDYLKVVKLIFSIVKDRRFFLLEEVAEEVVVSLMEKFGSILWVKLRVSKPGAILQAFNVGVIIERTREVNV